MGSSSAPESWKPLLLKAMEANAHLMPQSAFFQLATIGSNGRPSNRTMTFRGFEGDTDKIHICTDSRSAKIQEIKQCPFGEICWYLADSWEQFRISGKIEIVDASSTDLLQLQEREKAWFAMETRVQFLSDTPDLPAIGQKDESDPSAGPVDAFSLLVFDPEKAARECIEGLEERQQVLRAEQRATIVHGALSLLGDYASSVDYLSLKGNESFVFTSTLEQDGSKSWVSEKAHA